MCYLTFGDEYHFKRKDPEYSGSLDVCHAAICHLFHVVHMSEYAFIKFIVPTHMKKN